MGSPIPTLGYRSRVDAVAALHAKGMSFEQIGAAIGLSRRNARRVWSSRTRARTMDATYRNVRVPRDTLDALSHDAAARGVTVNVLVRELLDEIAGSNLTATLLGE